MNKHDAKLYSLSIFDYMVKSVNCTTIWCFIILGHVYKYLSIGVEAKMAYAHKSAATILPAIWGEEIWPMIWKIPLFILIDAAWLAFTKSKMR